MIKTYSDLRRLQTMEERFEYLKLGGVVGQNTFGYDRWMNQEFYRSRQWRHMRNFVMARDYGRDLGLEGYEIHDRVYVHHMNPIKPEDLIEGLGDVLDPEFLISVTMDTHNAIHYGDESHLRRRQPIERRAGDTKLW